MSKHISCATAVLRDPKDATSEIDRVLKAMLYYGRPGYIGILTDMITRTIQNVPEAISTIVPNGQQDGIEDVATPVAAIRDKVLSAKKLAIIADSGVTRHGITNETWELINLLQAPYFTTPMGKGGLTEAHKNYGGIYAGIASDPAAKEYVETADCVLRIGNVPSDLNTAIFSTKYQPKALVDIRQFSVNLDGRTLDANIKHLIPSLKNDLQSNGQTQSLSWPTCPSRLEEKILPPKDIITFDWFLQRLGQAFRPGDLIVAETGSVSIGISQVPLPEGATMFTQTLWGSIGYGVGASVGAFCAAKEQTQRYKRSILIVGDGSFQMTVQAVSDLVHLNPIIIVLNNAGYACERVFNGPNASYNDIREWDWQSLLRTFGPKVQSRSFHAKTPQELDALLSDPEIAEAKCAQLLEVVMEKHDVPKALKVCGEAVVKANSE
ncbi:Pyruvate decarboxylase 1 [Paecilomyces lecythidis]